MDPGILPGGVRLQILFLLVLFSPTYFTVLKSGPNGLSMVNLQEKYNFPRLGGGGGGHGPLISPDPLSTLWSRACKGHNFINIKLIEAKRPDDYAQLDLALITTGMAE